MLRREKWSASAPADGANTATFQTTPSICLSTSNTSWPPSIVATVHRADDRPTNLAWSCPRCNLRKGPNLTTIDVDTGDRVDLFDPRIMSWQEHFAIADGIVEGITPCGRGTAHLLDMNHEQRVLHRRRLIAMGEFDLE